MSGSRGGPRAPIDPLFAAPPLGRDSRAIVDETGWGARFSQLIADGIVAEKLPAATLPGQKSDRGNAGDVNRTRPGSVIVEKECTNLANSGSVVHLKTVLRRCSHTADLRDGKIPVDGVKLDFVDVQPAIAAYRRMVRDIEFDMCELAPTTYYIARAYGAPFKALPIFLTRQFHHQGLVVRADSGIRTPKDLEARSRRRTAPLPARRIDPLGITVEPNHLARRDASGAPGLLRRPRLDASGCHRAELLSRHP
jgi:hypothetical protein